MCYKRTKKYIPPNPLGLRYVDYSLTAGSTISALTSTGVPRLYMGSNDTRIINTGSECHKCVNCISTYGHPAVPANP